MEYRNSTPEIRARNRGVEPCHSRFSARRLRSLIVSRSWHPQSRHFNFRLLTVNSAQCRGISLQLGSGFPALAGRTLEEDVDLGRMLFDAIHDAFG